MSLFSTGELMLTSMFVAYESAFSYSQFLPSIFTIKHFSGEWEARQSIRQGEIIGTVFTTSFAVLFSLILKSWLPLLLAALACSFVLIVYEWALRTSDGYQSGEA